MLQYKGVGGVFVLTASRKHTGGKDNKLSLSLSLSEGVHDGNRTMKMEYRHVVHNSAHAWLHYM
jgi:hypothetical protein